MIQDGVYVTTNGRLCLLDGWDFYRESSPVNFEGDEEIWDLIIDILSDYEYLGEL